MLSDFENLWLAFLMLPNMKRKHFIIYPDLSCAYGDLDEYNVFTEEFSFYTLSHFISFLIEKVRPDKEAGEDRNVEGN